MQKVTAPASPKGRLLSKLQQDKKIRGTNVRSNTSLNDLVSSIVDLLLLEDI